MNQEQPSAAALLREARQRAALSQTELARRARVTQSMISAYESGQRQPSLPTLMRLVEATGATLRIAVEEPTYEQTVPRPLSGPVGRIVRQRRRELVAIAEAHGASRVRVFGSVARGEDGPQSDVDLLVDLPPGLGLLGYGRLVERLEHALGGITVDLVPAGHMKPDVRARVELEAIAL